MSGNCTSNPNNGCTDSQTYTFLAEFTTELELHLDAIISAIADIITDINACCATNNEKLTETETLLTTLKDNAENCCDAMQAAFDEIIGTLQEITGYICVTTTTTTVSPVTTTTTTSGVPATTTTTTASVPATTTTTLPVTTTTTTIGNVNGWFYSNEDIDFACLNNNPVHLYWNGALQVGTILYTDVVGGTPFTAYEYVRQSGQTTVYQINTESGAIMAINTNYCE